MIPFIQEFGRTIGAAMEINFIPPAKRFDNAVSLQGKMMKIYHFLHVATNAHILQHGTILALVSANNTNPAEVHEVRIAEV